MSDCLSHFLIFQMLDNADGHIIKISFLYIYIHFLAIRKFIVIFFLPLLSTIYYLHHFRKIIETDNIKICIFQECYLRVLSFFSCAIVRSMGGFNPPLHQPLLAQKTNSGNQGVIIYYVFHHKLRIYLHSHQAYS